MLYASTQAGDHGHPRAFARVELSVLPIVENIQNKTSKPKNMEGPARAADARALRPTYVASIKPASARPKPRSLKPTNAKQSPKNMRG